MANPPYSLRGKPNKRRPDPIEFEEEDKPSESESKSKQSPPRRRLTRQATKQLPLDSFLGPRSSPFDSPARSTADDGPQNGSSPPREHPKNSGRNTGNSEEILASPRSKSNEKDDAKGDSPSKGTRVVLFVKRSIF